MLAGPRVRTADVVIGTSTDQVSATTKEMEPTLTTIAFLGLGKMGTPMAQRLNAAGHQLIVWNRTPERARPLATEGARVAATPAEAARDADIVVTMLADPPAVEAVLFGADGVAETIRPTACLVEMSTIGPKAVAAIRARLPERVNLVDAPVMGSVGPAAEGTLTVLVGGDADRVEPVLETFGTVVRCGELGAGAARKLVRIAASVAGVPLVGELLALARALDVPEHAALDDLAGGPLAGALTRARNPRGDFAIRLAAKDLSLALEVADLPLLTEARAWLHAAAAEGLAEVDLRNVIDRIQPRR